jgi:hypothetical protein
MITGKTVIVNQNILGDFEQKKAAVSEAKT